MEEKKKRVRFLAANLQEECHDTADKLCVNENISYQDATNVFLFTKIAELQVANEILLDLFKQAKEGKG